MTPLTVALCQFRPIKGDRAANLDQIERAFRAATESVPVPQVLIFPEAILTGYFLEGAVREQAVEIATLFTELQERHQRSGAPPIDVCLGCYELFDGRLYNAAVWCELGGPVAGVRHVHRKVFLPTYGVFDEERFVESGDAIHAFDTRFGRVAMLVCEDAWHSITSTIAATQGAKLIAIIAASPARGLEPDLEHPGQPASLVRWDNIATGIAAEHGVFVTLTQLVGFEGGKGFPGGSIVVNPSGEVIARAPLFGDAMLCATLDLDEIARVRASAPLLADLEARLPALLATLAAPTRATVATATSSKSETAHAVVVPPPTLAIDTELTTTWLVEFLRGEVSRRRGFSKVVVGVSGGIDSAVTAYLASRAFGSEHVVGVRMPYHSSHPDSLAHARLVTEALRIDERTVDITAAVDGYVAACGNTPDARRLGNVMARVRMLSVFDVAAAIDGIPLGTGNKSERLLGYFTWHADDAPPINPIGDLYKTQVRQLAVALGVPDEIIDKPASADLVPGQTDESDFGIGYDRADPILELLLRGYRDATIVAAGFTRDEIALVRNRLDRTHWKRRLPSVAMVSQTAIGEYYLRPLDY